MGSVSDTLHQNSIKMEDSSLSAATLGPCGTLDLCSIKGHEDSGNTVEVALDDNEAINSPAPLWYATYMNYLLYAVFEPR